MNQSRERAEELANGGLVSRSGSVVTMGNGAQWWLIDERWARAEADALISRDQMILR